MREFNKNMKQQELRSKQVQEIMGRIPIWILRWGNTLLGIIVLGLIVAGYFITYPETLETNISITAISEPVPVYSSINGTILDCKVEHGDLVKSGDSLVVIKGNGTDYVLKSPIDGFFDRRGAHCRGTKISLNELFCMIVPNTTVAYVGVMKISPTVGYEVGLNHKVYVYIDGFPCQNYGCLVGNIITKSRTSDTDGILFVEVAFPDGLLTNRNVKLPELVEMQGQARIVLRERRLVEKLLSSIK